MCHAPAVFHTARGYFYACNFTRPGRRVIHMDGALDKLLEELLQTRRSLRDRRNEIEATRGELVRLESSVMDLIREEQRIRQSLLACIELDTDPGEAKPATATGG
jgi:hypothetical protein